MVAPSVVIYDLAFKRVAYLENATNLHITIIMNQVWDVSFRLPANDGKCIYCTDYYYAEIFDNGTRVGLFRIMDHSTVIMEQLYYNEYHCEHVLGKLMDDVIFGYVSTEPNGSTDEAILKALSYQTVPNWVLTGAGCDFNRLFKYEWENTNILSALFGIPAAFDGADVEFIWTWDDSVYPWVLNLERLAAYENAKIGIYYQKNLSQITRFRDPRSVITRIYPLGYGDGDNQLNIISVNPTGLAYIDADTIADYGVMSYIWVDRRYKDVNSLYSAACQKLESNKVPKVTYTATAADLSSITALESDTFVIGAPVRIRDDDISIYIVNRIVQIDKPDCINSPQTVDIKISNIRNSIVDSMSLIDSRQIVDETVSQGALNYFPFSIPITNVQDDYPLRYHVWLPDDDTKNVTLNKARIILYGYPFRIYTTVANDGYISQDDVILRQTYRDRTPSDEDATISVGTWVDLLEIPAINIHSLFLDISYGILAKIGSHSTAHGKTRLLVRDDPVTGAGAEYFPDSIGADLSVWQYMFYQHDHYIPMHHHHLYFISRVSGSPISVDTQNYPDSGSAESEGLVSSGGENGLCFQKDEDYIIIGDYKDKTVVLQAMMEDYEILCQAAIKVDAIPLPRIDTTMGINDPIDPASGDPYYPTNVTVLVGPTPDDLEIVADYATDTNLVGGEAFTSNEIDITEYLVKGHNYIEIRSETKGAIFGEGQVQFFQTTHGE
jgi:phage minor structural protein